MEEIVVKTKLEVPSKEECDLPPQMKIERTESKASIDSKESAMKMPNGVSLLQPPPLIWRTTPPDSEFTPLLFQPKTCTTKILTKKPKIEELTKVTLSATDMSLPPPLIWLNKPRNKGGSSFTLSHIQTKVDPETYNIQQMEVSSSIDNTLSTSNKKIKLQKLYKCNSCNFHTKYEKYFQLHQQKHTFHKPKSGDSDSDVKVFLCNGCSMVFVRQSDLREHLAVAHATMNDELFQCPKCEFQCEKAMDLINHQISHKYITSSIFEKAFKCVRCSFASDSKENCHKHIECYKNHIFKINIEGVGFSDRRFFKCKKCGFKTRYADYIKLHMRTHSDTKFSDSDSPLRLLYCQRCNFSTIFSQYLELHMHKHGSMDETATKLDEDRTSKVEGLFSCEFCSFNCKFEYELHLHVQVYHQNLLFSPQSGTLDASEYFDYHDNINCDDRLEFASFLCENHDNPTTPQDEHMLGQNSCDSSTYPFKVEQNHYLLPGADGQFCEQLVKEDSQNVSDNVLGSEPKSLATRELKCQVCDFQTKYVEYLELHNRKHIKSEGSQTVDDLVERNKSESEARTRLNPQIFYCNNCRFQTRIKVYLELHMSKHVPKNKNNQGTDRDIKKTQFLEVNDLVSKEEPKGLFACDDCDFVTHYKKYLDLHVTKHSDQ